jgi:hypothetical protein
MFSKKPEPTTDEILTQYGLDLTNYTPEQIKDENVKNIKKIAKELRGNKWIQAGFNVQIGKAYEKATLAYFNTLVEQNWILIRQNEAILRKIDR